MSRKEVDRLLGDPNHHKGECGYLKGVSRGCVLEYVYSHPLGPLRPEYYVVEFSSGDRVISAAHLVDK